jgi:hypothetical protein
LETGRIAAKSGLRERRGSSWFWKWGEKELDHGARKGFARDRVRNAAAGRGARFEAHADLRGRSALGNIEWTGCLRDIALGADVEDVAPGLELVDLELAARLRAFVAHGARHDPAAADALLVVGPLLLLARALQLLAALLFVALLRALLRGLLGALTIAFFALLLALDLLRALGARWALLGAGLAGAGASGALLRALGAFGREFLCPFELLLGDLLRRGAWVADAPRLDAIAFERAACARIDDDAAQREASLHLQFEERRLARVDRALARRHVLGMPHFDQQRLMRQALDAEAALGIAARLDGTAFDAAPFLAGFLALLAGQSLPLFVLRAARPGGGSSALPARSGGLGHHARGRGAERRGRAGSDLRRSRCLCGCASDRCARASAGRSRYESGGVLRAGHRERSDRACRCASPRGRQRRGGADPSGPAAQVR